MTKFYNCSYDEAFKNIFLKEENFDLLEEVLYTVLDTRVKILKVRNNELFKENYSIKKKIVDAVIEANNKVVEIEINNERQDFYRPRNMAYICNLYSTNTLSGESYSEDTDFIQINISYNINNKNKIDKFLIQNKDYEKYVNNFIIYEIDMKKLLKLWYSNSKEKEKFKYLIMMGLEKDELDSIPKGDTIMNKYKDKITKLNEEPEFQEYMTKEEDDRKMYNTKMNYAKKTGIEEGIKRGIKQGIEQGMNVGKKEEKIKIAKNMLKENLDIALISKITDLTEEEIKNLENN